MHKKSKGQSFLQGAFIMMAASLVVKVIGAFFQIPLQNLIGGEKSPAFGMFSAAYRIYTAMLVISTVGLPAALSKMVAEATARGREHEVRRIVRVAAGIFVPVGALCSLALFFGAGTFAAWIKSEDSRLAVMAIAPSVLMVAILSVFRGYYQGRSNMVPTAVSQVIEAAGKLFIGLGLACWAVGRGFDDPVVAALTVLGVTIGEAVAAAYMLVQAALSRGETRVRALDPAVRPTLTLAKTLHLRLVTITPDASALANFLPAVAPAQCVAWRDEHQWLWAMRHQWGRRFATEAKSVAELAALLALAPDDIALFDSQRDPWEIVSRCQPPLPECGADYTIALALAMSEVPE